MSSFEKIFVEGEVPFHDVDALRIVWHGHYYKYMEIARSALLQSRGLDNRELEHCGFHLLVAESKCRYTWPLRYRDRFRVAAWFIEIETRVVIAYEITNLTENCRSARGRTVLVCVDREHTLLHTIPETVRARLSGVP